MQEHEHDLRQENLRQAAEALVGWMQARRAMWPAETVEPGPEQAVAESLLTPENLVAATMEIPFTATPEFPGAYADAETADGEYVDTEAAEPLHIDGAVEPRRFQIPTAAIRSLAGPVFRWSLRVAPLAAVLAVVAGAGWLSRPYVRSLVNWAKVTTTASPKPEPVAVKAAPPPPAAARVGRLLARSEPPGAQVLVDGRERGVTPLTLDDVSVGSHTVVIQSDKGSVRRTVTVAADRPAVVSESIFAGWLSVFAPFELEITEGSRSIQLDESGRVLLPPGTHDLWLENRSLGYRETRRVEVKPGQTTSLSLVPSPSTLTVAANAPAVVLIDGVHVGDTPLTDHPIGLGTRGIVVRSADGAEREFTTRVTVAPVRIDVDFSKP